MDSLPEAIVSQRRRGVVSYTALTNSVLQSALVVKKHPLFLAFFLLYFNVAAVL